MYAMDGSEVPSPPGNLCGFIAGRQETQSLGKEQSVCSSTGALEKVGCGTGVVLHAHLRVWLQMVSQVKDPCLRTMSFP